MDTNIKLKTFCTHEVDRQKKHLSPGSVTANHAAIAGATKGLDGLQLIAAAAFEQKKNVGVIKTLGSH